MANYLLGHASDAWDCDRTALAASCEAWFKRPLKRENPGKYITVDEQRRLRLKIIGELLGRDAGSPLASFLPIDHPEKGSLDNMNLVEARALRTFIDRASLEVHAEVIAEYDRQVRELLNAKETAAQRVGVAQLGKVDRHGDVQLFLPELQSASPGPA